MTKRDIEVLAMQIVNKVNERTGVSVEVRQETNDANFDDVMDTIIRAFPGEVEREQEREPQTSELEWMLFPMD